MKKYIRSNSETSYTNADIVNLLNERGIDTTKCSYELKAEKYERYTQGDMYVIKFSCPGDWLAYWSMLLHRCPTASAFQNGGWYLDEIEEYMDGYPTADDLREYAESVWYGDGDDFIIYLKNLTTGEYLVDNTDSIVEDEYEEWED